MPDLVLNSATILLLRAFAAQDLPQAMLENAVMGERTEKLVAERLIQQQGKRYHITALGLAVCQRSRELPFDAPVSIPAEEWGLMQGHHPSTRGSDDHSAR